MRILRNTVWTAVGLFALAALVAMPAAADQVILDDLIVDGSICVGLDCVNGESFGFDTLRLKENNLRIKAQDTSSSASFPTNDWQITFNESSNGGRNKFSIDDIDGGRTPLTIEASAPSHSLYVDDGGRLGFGTSTPVADLHVKSGNTPTLRLEQDGSSGFTAQTWDVAGNEANFFIRDATNGSTLPLRIQPGVASNAIFMEASTSDVGFGTTSPVLDIHIVDNEIPGMRLEDANDAVSWDFRMETNQDFLITEDGTGGAEFIIADGAVSASTRKFTFGQGPTVLVEILGDGDVNSLTGVFGSISDRSLKKDITPVDPRAVLAKLNEIPISTWRFKEHNDSLHMGPMAQDFWAAFGLHEGDKSIALNDLSGVALAAIQGLSQVIVEKESAIQQLLARVEALEAKLAE